MLTKKLFKTRYLEQCHMKHGVIIRFFVRFSSIFNCWDTVFWLTYKYNPVVHGVDVKKRMLGAWKMR